ncbi:MAG: methyltransferase family protein [Promethearchaeota archaeon]
MRSQKYGEKGWDDCKRYRKIAGVFMIILVTNMILWYWIPVPELSWPLYSDSFILIILGIALAVPFTLILVKALKDAGRESFEPSKDTKLYGGIYNYIRHPQLLGRTPLTLVLTMWLNSLFLFVFAAIFLAILVPSLVYFEERDLELRFGESYLQYKERTGAFLPRFQRRKK